MPEVTEESVSEEEELIVRIKWSDGRSGEVMVLSAI